MVNTCSRRGCTVDLANAPSPYVLIDIDRCAAVDSDLKGMDGERCDYVFVGESKDNGWVVLMEFKGGANVRYAKAVRQLAAGVRWTERKLEEHEGVLKVVPVVVIKKGLTQRRDQYRRLKLRPVECGGRKWPVRLLRCGERLANIIRT